MIVIRFVNDKVISERGLFYQQCCASIHFAAASSDDDLSG